MDYAVENQRMRTLDAYNMRLPQGELVSRWELPQLLPVAAQPPDDLIGFNVAMSSKTTDVGVHFFIDDYQFERVWRAPQRYVARLRQFQAVCTPDFSTYTDMPLPMQLWNVYRSRAIGTFWQTEGMNVIPTLQWADVETLDWCFEGLPKHSMLAVSSLGVRNNSHAEALWRAGMGEALRVLEPELVLLHGSELEDFDWKGVAVERYTDHIKERLEKIDGRKRK